MELLLYSLHTSALVLFAFAVAYSLHDSLHVRILKMYAIFASNIIGLHILLGVFLQTLTLDAISIVCSVEAILAFFLLFRKKIRISFQARTKWKVLWEAPWIVVLSMLVGSVIGYLFWTSLKLMPYSYDSTAYHLPNLVDYIQSQKIWIAEKLVWSNTYPKHMEMLFLWDLIHIRTGASLAVQQFLCAIIGGVAVYGILILNNIRKRFAFLGSLLYLSTPIVLAQLTTNYVDVALASVLLLCLYFLSHMIKDSLKTDVVYFGMVLGILLGLKTSSIAYFAIFIFVASIVFLSQKVAYQVIFQRVCLIAAIAIPFGAIWYILNIINFGNPIYPFQLTLLGLEVFPGLDVKQAIMVPNTPEIMRNTIPLVQIFMAWSNLFSGKTFDSVEKIGVNYDEAFGGFGFAWILLLVPSIVYYVFHLLKNHKVSGLDLVVFFVPTLCFIVTPSNWWTRYTCYILIVGIYSFVSLLAQMTPKKTKTKLLFSIVVIFVLFNVLQGSVLMVNKYKYLNNVSVGEQYALRSSYVQASSNPAYRTFFKEINQPNQIHKIIALEPTPASILFWLYGDRTQNILKYYPYEFDQKTLIPNVKADFKIAKAEFDQILQTESPDYIIVSKPMIQYVDSNIFKQYLDVDQNIIFKKLDTVLK